MRNDHRFGRPIEQAKHLGHSDHLLAESTGIASRSGGAVSHSRQVVSDDMEVCGKEGRNERETPRMSQKAVSHQDRWVRRVTPTKVMYESASYFYEAVVARNG